MFEDLRDAVLAHGGEFACRQIHGGQGKKTVRFNHVVGARPVGFDLPDMPGLAGFYGTFGSLTLYLDEESGESAFHLAEPAQWPALQADFLSWLDGMGEDELEECMPSPLDGCIVVGEIPGSGNYLLVSTSGPDAGKVYEFEHDGFEFIERGRSLADFVQRALTPGSRELTGMASHMRFIAKGNGSQWWVTEMRDNLGRVVATDAG